MALQPTISVIVTTYNWPSALDHVLAGLAEQSYAAMEVIIADDGSGEETKACISQWQSRVNFPLKHCWQPDEGFRAGQIRNKAVLMASHDYIIFLDGDCIPQPSFVKRHAQLAEKGWFVSGTRLLLQKEFTHQLLQGTPKAHRLSFVHWCLTRLKGDCNRCVTLLPFPLGWLRRMSPKRWQGVKTCNLGVWREDVLRVNGFDAHFSGWGFEDSDLIIRLLRCGFRRKQGKYATTVLHLWHPEQDRSALTANQALLDRTLLGNAIWASDGIAQILPEKDVG